MKARIVRIGNRSLAIRARHPREGWSEAFRDMAAHGDDALINEYRPTRWDETEWEW